MERHCKIQHESLERLKARHYNRPCLIRIYVVSFRLITLLLATNRKQCETRVWRAKAFNDTIECAQFEIMYYHSKSFENIAKHTTRNSEAQQLIGNNTKLSGGVKALDNISNCVQFEFIYHHSESFENIAKHRGHGALERLSARQYNRLCSIWIYVFFQQNHHIAAEEQFENNAKLSSGAPDYTIDCAKFEFTYLPCESFENIA